MKVGWIATAGLLELSLGIWLQAYAVYRSGHKDKGIILDFSRGMTEISEARSK